MTKKTLFQFIVCGVIGSGLQEPVLADGCGNCCAAVPTTLVSTNALTDAEVTDVMLMREEEKLARDVYNAMHELYELRVFSNIPRSEQRHMDAVLGLLRAYGLDDPARKEPGKFENTELQQLYDDLVLRGAKSRQDAFLVGALIEEVDIEDLVEAMKRTDREDILSVYDNLLGGSKRHLNAFVRNYEALSGETYQAQKIPQKEVDAILGR